MGISALVFVMGLPAFAASGYLGVLGCCARPARHDSDKPQEPSRLPHFTFVVPAHNEALGITRTVKSLLLVDYPGDRFSVLVIADNCTDSTKEQAELAGARVLERNDESKRGKGYALEYAFETLVAAGDSDALVVVDADTDVSSNLLRAMAERLNAGELAMQAHYGVRNIDESWRTQLMDFAFTLYHGVRSDARERLRLSAGLRGNGMGFALDTLRRVPHRSYSLVEDVEYGIQLGMRGIRVAYVGEAEVRGEMVAGRKGSESQRRRWEQGRQRLIAQYVPTLLTRAIRERSGLLLDLALDILTPPLSNIAGYTVLGSAGAAAIVITGLGQPAALIPWSLALAGLAIYVGSGVRMSSRGPQVLVSLLHAPKYALWKLALGRSSSEAKNNEWVRTTRARENSGGPKT
jgi:1,2-diacylglycerol 3-beta-glucosyltransferase